MLWSSLPQATLKDSMSRASLGSPCQVSWSHLECLMRPQLDGVGPGCWAGRPSVLREGLSSAPGLPHWDHPALLTTSAEVAGLPWWSPWPAPVRRGAPGQVTVLEMVLLSPWVCWFPIAALTSYRRLSVFTQIHGR